jgi:hypothetical protein
MASWKCLNCGSKKGVTNGICPKCGPTQTDPMDYDAKVEAEVIVPGEKKILVEEAEIVEEKETKKKKK